MSDETTTPVEEETVPAVETPETEMPTETTTEETPASAE